MTRRTSARSGSARRRAASSSASNQTPMILVGVGVVVVIAIFVISGGGGDDDKGGKSKADKGGAKTTSSNTGTQDTSPAPSSNGIAAQPGKTPDRKAPTIDRRWFGTVNEAYEQAKELSNEGKKAQAAGDPSTMQAKFVEAKRILRAGLETIPQGVWDWDDEAQIEGWARPSEYVELSRWYAKWSKLDQQLHRLGR